MTSTERTSNNLHDAIVASVEESELENLVEILGSEEAQAAVAEHQLPELVAEFN